MAKSLKNIALGTLVSLAAVAYGNTTWYFNSSLGIDTTSQANGNMVLGPDPGAAPAAGLQGLRCGGHADGCGYDF